MLLNREEISVLICTERREINRFDVHMCIETSRFGIPSLAYGVTRDKTRLSDQLGVMLGHFGCFYSHQSLMMVQCGLNFAEVAVDNGPGFV